MRDPQVPPSPPNMFPSSSKASSVPGDSVEYRGMSEPSDEQQIPPSSDVSSPSRFQSNYGSRRDSNSSHLASSGPTSSGWDSPTPVSSAYHSPRIGDEQVSSPLLQGAGIPIPPFYSPSPSQYTAGFIPSPGNSPVPRLRPASWGPPSQAVEAFESHQLTRSRSSTNFRGDSSDNEDLPFGGRTLPPLFVRDDPWPSGTRTGHNIGSSGDYSPGSEDMSTTSSMPSTSFSNYPDRGYRSTSDQPEASTSAHRLPNVLPPILDSEPHPTDATARPRRGRPKKPRPTPAPRVSRQTVSKGQGQHRDNLPEPGDVGIIECGWTGCESPIQHDIRSVKDHVRFHHGGLFRSKEPLTCRWVRKDTGEECGSMLLPGSLCRHTLDVHTNLIMMDCACGKRFRRDTLGRHRCEAQGNL